MRQNFPERVCVPSYRSQIQIIVMGKSTILLLVRADISLLINLLLPNCRPIESALIPNHKQRQEPTRTDESSLYNNELGKASDCPFWFLNSLPLHQCLGAAGGYFLKLSSSNPKRVSLGLALTDRPGELCGLLRVDHKLVKSIRSWARQYRLHWSISEISRQTLSYE